MRKVLELFSFFSLLIVRTSDSALTERSGRTRRSVPFCTYSYIGVCERTVRCPFAFFETCFQRQTVNCSIPYKDCCAGDVMDGGICYSEDEICEDCYTVTDCDGKITKISTRYGVITSKNYPRPYANNQDCTWTIKGPRNSTISIEMVDFRLQRKRETNCIFNWEVGRYECEGCVDWLRLQGEPDSDFPMVQECGTKTQFDNFVTTGRTATITFHSDASRSERGFQLIFTVVGGADPTPPTTTTESTTTTTTTTTAAPTTVTTTSTSTTTTTEQTTKPDPPSVSLPDATEDTPSCPGKLVWNSCPKCTRTCTNYKQSEEDCVINFSSSSPSAANRICRAGCACPDDFPIWHKLDCVKKRVCIDDAKTQTIEVCATLGLERGDCLRTCDNMQLTREECILETIRTATFIDGAVCVCPAGQYMIAGSCVSRTVCQKELNKRCPGRKVWTLCPPVCDETCDPTTKFCSNPPAVCKPGCACPKIAPVMHKGRCISKNKCPADREITCGKQHYQPLPKIVGGDEAIKGSWPWMVQIEKMLEGKFALVCGGTLICDRWVLTASHCFLSAGKLWIDKDLKKYRLSIGKHHKEFNRDDASAGMLYGIIPKRIITHEDYDLSTHVNDIALIELPRAVPMSRLIRPACVFNQTDDYSPRADRRETCISAGWGADTNQEVKVGSAIRVLKQVTLAARVHSLCTALFFHFDIQRMHCVGGQRNADTCAGDSGGPLMCLRNNRWYVDGVVSFGLKCGVADQPGVYSRVPFYSEWIFKHTGKQCGSPDTVWRRST